ncbi:MAG: ABC transporter permease [Armatimonadetes bacterium]|nr:ABC transporter permease [Armatimonadota bacterium]
MVLVLVALCGYFAWATYGLEAPTGPAAAAALAEQAGSTSGVVVVAGMTPEEEAFALAVTERLAALGRPPLASLHGDPSTVREGLDALATRGRKVELVLATQGCAAWSVFGELRVVTPQARKRSLFLAKSNLRNIADQIAVIAIIAVGMTAVIITGGIDLSVGSLLALAAVGCAWLVSRWGGERAGLGVLLLAASCATLLCGLVGLFSGLMITRFRIPPFIVTLAMMQVASGLAFMLAKGQSIYDLPASCTWLGRGADPLLGVPFAVWLMLATYAAAQLVMTRTTAGRAVYAVGGNPEAARLSGLRTQSTLLWVYLASGLAAGLGGVVTVSQLKAGAPTYGVMYELYVIAAVVVGGTSLSGGQGSMLGTLVGAFIIAVIRNGMNLMGIEPYTQKVVLGMVILLAVLLDMLKKRR